MLRESLLTRESALIFLVFCLLSMIGICTNMCSNARAEEDLNSPSGFSGMEMDQAKRAFGEPDRIEGITDGSERWFYGTSELYFSNGKVVLWRDYGDFNKRKQLTALKPKKKADSRSESGWVNSWTPSEALSPEDVVEEIVSDRGKTR